MRILLIEADDATARVLIAALAHQNYVIELVKTPEESWLLLDVFLFDLIVLDRGLAEWSEPKFCQRVRSRGHQMPILVLTSDRNGHEMALGLDAGADDYMVKPFDPEELEARIRALLRRGNLNANPILTYAGLSLDPSTHTVQFESKPLTLTPKEYALIELLLRNQNRVFSCALILEQVWAYDEIPGEDAVRTHIKGVRHKLKNVGAPSDLIETVYGIGYRLNPQLLQRDRPSAAVVSAPQPHCATSTPASHALQTETLSAIANVLDRFKRDRPSLQSVPVVSGALPVSPALPLPDPDQPTAKLWLVGSEQTTLQALQTLLMPWGLAIACLPNPSQVWLALPQNPPDLLVLDAARAPTEALDLCQAIRNDDRWSYLPIVILTADTSAATVNQLFAVGADDFVSQPIVGPELITRIVNRLERAKLFKRLSDRCPVAQIDPKMVCPYQPDRFFNLSQDLLCTVKLDGTFYRLNPAFEQTLGYRASDLRQQSFLTFVHPDDYQQTAMVFNQALLGMPMTHLENRYRCKDGAYKRLAWHSVPGIEDEIIYAIAHVVDS